MRMSFIALGVLGGIIVSAAAIAQTDEPKQVKIGVVRWYTDYDAAMSIAKKTGKPVWLHFGENPG